MILPKPGILSKAQDLTAGSTDSTNTIQMAAIDWSAFTDLWLVIDTETIATGDASDTYKFALVLASEAGLDMTFEVVSVTITAYTDYRIATAGNHILAINIGKMLNEILGASLSDYPHLGLISTISVGATISINAALSTVEPPTISHAQPTKSTVGVPTHCSAAS